MNIHLNLSVERRLSQVFSIWFYICFHFDRLHILSVKSHFYVKTTEFPV